MKAVIAGCGNVTRAWFEDIQPLEGIQIVGLVDLVEDNARILRSEQDLPPDLPVGDDLRTVISASDADTVFDCTVPQAHYEIVTTALECGCHVLGEKPLAATLEQARAMVLMARDKGKTYAVIQNRRYLDSIRRVKDVLDQESIGRTHTFNADFFLGCHFGGFREDMDHVLLLDMAIHSFDQARYLCPSRPVSVFCHDYNPPGSWYAHGASAVAVFRMDDGSVFSYRGSWCAEGLNTSWQCDWRIIGDKGSLLWDGENQIMMEKPVEDEGFIRRQKTEAIDVRKDLEYSGRSGVIADFHRSVLEGRVPHTSAGDNIISLAMVLAAIRSADSGLPVDITYDESGLPHLNQEQIR